MEILQYQMTSGNFPRLHVQNEIQENPTKLKLLERLENILMPDDHGTQNTLNSYVLNIEQI